ncbi:MAG: hypothetical protein A2007_03800 [Verrucomicrobia bacterium GWC2_42_7]|nr:MAG: hypothetical protein A2007_03800 [Verrucomicrobia bacterium GWC2_42_7]
MGTSNFFETLDYICSQDPRYDKKAYLLVRQALDFTVEEIKKKKPDDSSNHISGKELLEGFRIFVLNEFGPMANLLCDAWGIRSTEDVGAIVFNMVNNGILGKSENDRVEDFSNGYNFDEAFLLPFVPKKRPPLMEPPKSPKRTKKRKA